MASNTLTLTEQDSSYKATWTFTFSISDITASDSTFVIPNGTVTAKYTYSGKTQASAEVYYCPKVNNSIVTSNWLFGKANSSNGESWVSWSSGTTKTLVNINGYSSSVTVNTSSYFTSLNKDKLKIPLQLAVSSVSSGSRKPTSSTDWNWDNSIYKEYSTPQNIFSTPAYITLNAPPEIELGTPTYVSPHYTGLGAYTVPITTASAQYGGDISKVTLTIGTDSTVQTYSSAMITNQTISVVPTIAGSFTPTITVEDSRGQITTRQLSEITVNSYDKPSVAFDVYRTDEYGVKSDEGRYSLIESTINFTYEAANLTEPEVYIDNELTTNVTWYSVVPPYDNNSTPISDWSIITYTGNTPPTIYGLIDEQFQTEQSYQITLIEEDSLNGKSSPITQTLSTAFYTIDFQAGGKEIAFGLPANDNLTNYPVNFNTSDKGLFKCGMIFINTQMIGEIKTWAGVSIPTGWLECDGSEKLISDYPLLAAALGADDPANIDPIWGIPSDNDHFVLPNLKGKVPVGNDLNDEDFEEIGKSGGRKDAIVPYHNHSVNAVSISSSGAHTNHTLKGYGATLGSGSTGWRFGSSGSQTATGIIQGGAHTHSVPAHNTNYIGTDGQETNANLQPYAVVKYIICAV